MLERAAPAAAPRVPHEARLPTVQLGPRRLAEHRTSNADDEGLAGWSAPPILALILGEPLIEAGHVLGALAFRQCLDRHLGHVRQAARPAPQDDAGLSLSVSDVKSGFTERLCDAIGVETHWAFVRDVAEIPKAHVRQCEFRPGEMRKHGSLCVWLTRRE